MDGNIVIVCIGLQVIHGTRFAHTSSIRHPNLPRGSHQAMAVKLLPMLDSGLDGLVAFDVIDSVIG